jgi:hypothetical protein
MEVIFPILVIVIVTGIIGIAIYVNHQQEKKRTEKFGAIADELGLQFFPTETPTVNAAVQSFRLFNQGHGREFKNIIFGQTEEVTLSIFSYKYTIGGGKNSHTHHQSVCCVQSSQLQLPEFGLSPENFFHRIGQIFGYQDINFDTHPSFSKQFLLRGPEEDAIRTFFTARRLDYFESNPGISIEANGDRFIVFRASKRIQPEEVRSFMEQGFEVYGQLKNEP